MFVSVVRETLSLNALEKSYEAKTIFHASRLSVASILKLLARIFFFPLTSDLKA